MLRLGLQIAVVFAVLLGVAALPHPAQEQGRKKASPAEKAQGLLKGVKRNIYPDKSKQEILEALEMIEEMSTTINFTNTQLEMLLKLHTDPAVRKQAAWTLAIISRTPSIADPSVRALTKGLDDRDPEVRASCFVALAQIVPHSKSAAPRAIKEMKNDDPRIRRGAISLLGNLARYEKQFIQEVIKALDDPDTGSVGFEPGYNSVSMLAMMRLEHCKSSAKAAVPKLIEIWTKKKFSRHYQGKAMGTLIAIDPEHPLPLKVARECLKHKEDPMQLRTGANTLCYLGPHGKAALPELISVLKMPPLANAEEERQLKACVLAAFGAMGPAAKETLPLLRSMLPTENANLRAYIENAIDNIEGTK